MNYKNFSNLSDDIRKNIHKIQDYQFDLVVGLPRSGMIPAYIIALYLNLECTDLKSFIDNKPLKKGRTRGSGKSLTLPEEAKKILMIDDSIMTGKSLAKDLLLIPENLREKITTLAIYSSTKSREDVNIFFEYLPSPRVFEWNIFHHSVLSKTCVDIDGVLCIDPAEEENDDGEKYIDFILNATPLFLPTVRIHSLVTSRLEKYRSETEQWLSTHNIVYDNLIMLDLPSKEERQRLKAHSTHKASYYKNSETVFFIESEAGQSSEICYLTGKSVYCVDNNTIYNSNFLNKSMKQPTRLINNIPERLINNIPRSVKKILRPLKYLLNKK